MLYPRWTPSPKPLVPWGVGRRRFWFHTPRFAIFGMVMTITGVWPALGVAQAKKEAKADCVFTLQSGGKPVCMQAPPAPNALVATEEVKKTDTAPGYSPQPSAVAAAPQPKWTLQLQDLTLHAAFSRWAKEAGWRVLWDADKHLLIDSPDVVTGDFEQAIAAVLSSPGIANGTYPLEVCFYPNTPPLVRITKRGEQAKDCK